MTEKKQGEGTLPANLGDQLSKHDELPQSVQLPTKGLTCSLQSEQKLVNVANPAIPIGKDGHIKIPSNSTIYPVGSDSY
jgi:hypothetical protein